MSLEDGKVLDTVMLEGLAVIAAAHERSLVEELNHAVRAYVMSQLAEQAEALDASRTEGVRTLIE